MENNFEQLVVALSRPALSTEVLHQITLILMQQTDQSLSSFVSRLFQSLLILEQWAWQLLSQDSLQWINQPYYQELFYTLASFNKRLIFTYDKIEVDTKASLLIPETVDQLNRIFKHIEQSNDDNNPFITIVNLWFDNCSYFLHNNPQNDTSPVNDHIGQYFVQNYVMNKQFKFYLVQCRSSQIKLPMFTAKMLFYIKTCSFYLYAYLGIKLYNRYYTADEVIRYIGEDYLQIIHAHSHTAASWNKELLACIAHLIALVGGCCWGNTHMGTEMDILFPTEQITCEHVQDLMRIIAHEPFYKQIKPQRSNDETILLDSSLLILLNIVYTKNINWFFRSNTTIQKILLTVAEISVNDKICLIVYGIMGRVLTEEQLKELKIADTTAGFLFNILEQAWHHPSKQHKHIPISYLLECFQNLSKNDCVQQKTADLNKIPLLLEICNQYPVVYDILWALSFNQDIQEQLRSNSSFMSKLSHLAKDYDNEQMRKVIYGILWNLEINHVDRSLSEIKNEKIFDIMISYSHKNKILCQQIYNELIKSGYRVWIDFDQMHGNIMDAMAQAIEQSHTIIICTSDDYRRSNYCRAEAHYAFQRQLKIVPVLLQEHYKPDGWLLFLIGQLLYVDFTRYEFVRAIEILLKELKAENISEMGTIPVRPLEDTDPLLSMTSTLLSSVRPENILEWAQTHVQNWLIEHNLIQMSRLLADCDGRSLVYLSKYMKNNKLRHISNSFREDSLRRLNQNLSFIELSRLQSLMDQQLLNQ